MVLTVSAEITSKNRHCLRGPDVKYGKWNEILRDNLNGKLRIVHNRKRTEADSEDDDDDDDDDEEEIPEETGRVYDTSERNGRYQPIRIDPENEPHKRYPTINVGIGAEATGHSLGRHDFTRLLIAFLKKPERERERWKCYTVQSSITGVDI